MTRNSNEVEQAVSRTLRDSLEKLRQTTGDLDQAVNDLISACASSRPSNSLPPMLRARTAAASLAASLEVLSKFVMMALQLAPPTVEQEFIADTPSVVAAPALRETAVAAPAVEASAPEAAVAPGIPADSGQQSIPFLAHETTAPVLAEQGSLAAAPSEPAETAPAQPVFVDEIQPAPAEFEASVPPALESWHDAPQHDGQISSDAVADIAGLQEHSSGQQFVAPAAEVLAPSSQMSGADSSGDLDASIYEVAPDALPPEAAGFDVMALAPEQQELHRRANRVAKVSMQDVKMLRPKDVALGKEHKDLCVRLRDDIEKAHREYDRRFHAISDHPVDYFYDWMVQILGDGDPETLGQYPYPSPVLRR